MGLGQVIGATLLVGTGALCSLLGVGHLWNYYRMRSATPADVRRLDDPEGEVEFEGVARVHESTSRSPFTDTEAVLQRWKVRERRESSDGSNWHTLDAGGSIHPFVLETDTGSVLVEAADATPYLTETTERRVEPDETPPPAIEEYLSNADDVDREHRRPRLYTERRLDPGDDVYVYGPVLETGLSVDLPGGVDADVGVDDPDHGWTLGEDSLSELREQVRSDTDQFVLTNDDEAGAQRHMLKTGAVWTAFGLLMISLPLVGLVLLG